MDKRSSGEIDPKDGKKKSSGAPPSWWPPFGRTGDKTSSSSVPPIDQSSSSRQSQGSDASTESHREDPKIKRNENLENTAKSSAESHHESRELNSPSNTSLSFKDLVQLTNSSPSDVPVNPRGTLEQDNSFSFTLENGSTLSKEVKRDKNEEINGDTTKRNDEFNQKLALCKEVFDNLCCNLSEGERKVWEDYYQGFQKRLEENITLHEHLEYLTKNGLDRKDREAVAAAIPKIEDIVEKFRGILIDELQNRLEGVKSDEGLKKILEGDLQKLTSLETPNKDIPPVASVPKETTDQLPQANAQNDKGASSEIIPKEVPVSPKATTDQSRTSISPQERLEQLVLAKVGEELIGDGEKDLVGLGFDKYLGFDTITTINMKKFEAKNLRVYEKNGIYYITTIEQEKKYEGYNNETEKISNTLIKDIRLGFIKAEWDLPKIHAVRRDNWRNAKEMPGVLITDNEKDLPQMLAGTSDAGKTQNSKDSGWKRIFPSTHEGINLSNSDQLKPLKDTARKKLEDYATKKITKSLQKFFEKHFPGKEVKGQIGKDVYFSKEGKILITNKNPGEGWERAKMSVKQLRKIRESIWDNQLKMYVFQRPNENSTGGESKDKELEVLVTDDTSLVTKRRNEGWQALPGTEDGIELRSDNSGGSVNETGKVGNPSQPYVETSETSSGPDGGGESRNMPRKEGSPSHNGEESRLVNEYKSKLREHSEAMKDIKERRASGQPYPKESIDRIKAIRKEITKLRQEIGMNDEFVKQESELRKRPGGNETSKLEKDFMQMIREELKRDHLKLQDEEVENHLKTIRDGLIRDKIWDPSLVLFEVEWMRDKIKDKIKALGIGKDVNGSTASGETLARETDQEHSEKKENGLSKGAENEKEASGTKKTSSTTGVDGGEKVGTKPVKDNRSGASPDSSKPKGSEQTHESKEGASETKETDGKPEGKPDKLVEELKATRSQLKSKWKDYKQLLYELNESREGEKGEKEALDRLGKVGEEIESLKGLLKNPEMVKEVEQEVEDWYWQELRKDKTKQGSLESELGMELSGFIEKPVPFTDNNCLLYALLVADGKDIGKEGSPERKEINKLLDTVRENLQNAGIVKKGEMLNPSDLCGEGAIAALRHDGYLSKLTNITVYRVHDDGRIWKYSLLPGEEGSNPLRVCLKGEGRARHYFALRQPEGTGK